MKKTALILMCCLALFSCNRDDIVPDQYKNTGNQQGTTPGGTDPTQEPKEDDPDDVDWAKAVAYVFDSSVVPEIHVNISEAEWTMLLAYYDNDHDTQDYVQCDVTFKKGNEVTTVQGAGLRLKGNTSRRRPYMAKQFHHVHFGIDLHKYTKDAEHTIKGLRKFDLKWFKDDPAYVRELYCYDLFRREGVWTGINDVYARLWLKIGDKEVYYGVYELMEHIDKNYPRIRKDKFGDRHGNLWKCAWGANLRSKNKSIGVDDNKTKFTYELKTNKEEGFAAAKAQLLDFIGSIASLSGTQFNNWIVQHMDVDMLLKTYAVNVAVGMWDDYWNNTNNYYLYFTSDPVNYKVWFVPYDYDNTLGTTIQCGVQSDAGRQSPLQWGSDDSPLMVKVLQNSEWKARYIQYLKELCAGSFSQTASAERIKAWQGMIKQYVVNDTGEDMTVSDKPASWSNHGEYRLLENSSNNFFKVKAQSIDKL